MSDALTFLPARGFIRITGRDWRGFLQGLLTKDMNELSPGELGYAYLLNARSRIVADLFLYVTADDAGVVLSCADAVLAKLCKILTLYKLRANVSIEQVAYQEMVSMSVHAGLGGPDPRLDGLGFRYLIADGDCNFSSQPNSQDHKDWTKKRLRQGVLEGLEYGEEALFPMECNGQFLNALSFDKGCYIGQELITRTKRVGEVRKLVFPGEVGEVAAEITPGQAVYFEGDKVGKVLFVCGDLAIMQLQFKRLPVIEKPIVSTDGNANITVLVPEVLHANLD